MGVMHVAGTQWHSGNALPHVPLLWQEQDYNRNAIRKQRSLVCGSALTGITEDYVNACTKKEQ